MSFYGPEVMLSVMSHRQGSGECLSALGIGAMASSAALTANRAQYMPLYFDFPGLITKLWCLNGATAAGNLDMGIYTEVAGLPAVRLGSMGSTAQAGTNVIQEFNITDIPVMGQTRYFLGIANDTGTATLFRASVIATAFVRMFGHRTEASAFPLPSNATPAVSASAVIPQCGVAFRALVA